MSDASRIARSDLRRPDAPEASATGPTPWLPWLLRLRWAAAGGLLLTVASARWAFGIGVPGAVLLGIVAFTAASNAAVRALFAGTRAPADALAAAVLALDVVLLSVVLGLTGGPGNPFSVLYLVYVVLAALVLGLRSALAIAVLCAAGYATLFGWHVPVTWDAGAGSHAGHAGHAEGAIDLHLQGMWVATAVTAGLLAYFVSRTAAALRERDEQVRRLERERARDEKLVSLSTLAAGAAHELGSPLATIAVAARELERVAAGAGAHLVEDARLIRAEVERCRAIVTRMSGEAGADLGEGIEEIGAGALLDAVLALVEPRERARVRRDAPSPEPRVRAPRDALARALASLVRNALAAAPEAPVELRVSAAGETVRFQVSDAGSGMAPEIAARAGEPFFTTRAPGDGMGLGIFLARAVAERLGGRVWLESAPQRGTQAFLEVRRDPLAGRPA